MPIQLKSVLVALLGFFTSSGGFVGKISAQTNALFADKFPLVPQ